LSEQFRPEFAEALKLLARAFTIYAERTTDAAVLVGGAAVEYYTGSRITTGDFDVIAGNDEAFADAVEAVGFRREDRAGRLMRLLSSGTTNRNRARLRLPVRRPD
jgi:hypothetical protein